jgi:hypothetical protein
MNWGHDIDDEIQRERFLSLRKERYKNKARKNMKSIKEVLLNAAYHTQAVMARAHVEPGHDIKVGQFITSLKSELQSHPDKSKFANLTSRSVWDDVLKLSSCSKGSASPEVVNAIKEAFTDYHYSYDGFSGVTRRLDAMKDAPDSLMNHVKAMRDLNVQAEHIMNSICELADTIEE